MTKQNKMIEPRKAEAGWAKQLKRLYGITDELRVLGFLEQHRFMVDLLIDALPRIQEHFPGSQASLQLDRAPLEDSKLTILVATSRNPVDVFKQRQQFESDWWRASLTKTKGKLQLRIEFQKLDDAAPWLKPTARALELFLAFPQNWNSYGARPLDPGCAAYALEVLHSVMREDTPPPQVVPTSTGGVQFEWHTRGIDLEIEVGEGGGHVLYENLRTKAEWEGEIPADLVPIKHIIADLSR